jgi:hypothetical protein
MTSHRQSVPPPEGGAHHVDEHAFAQEALSAAADGEQHDEVALRAARRHADRCDDCGRYRSGLERLRPEPPATPPRRTVFAPPPAALRVALWCFAVVNVAAGIPLLLRFDDVGLSGADPSHLTRDGALAVVLGVIAGVVAHQPRRARAMSMVVLSVLALNVIGGWADVARGAVTPGFESIHVVNGITAALILACAWVTRPSVRLR